MPKLSRIWRSAFGVVIVALALISALVTFLVLANFVPVMSSREIVLGLFTVNGILISILLVLVGNEVFRLVRARRAGLAASGLHVRIVGLFGFVAATPAVLMAVVGWLTLERGIDLPFNQSIQELVTTSADVATSYREVQCRALGREIGLMAADLGRARPVFDQNRDFFRDYMRTRSYFLGFYVAVLIQSDKTILERIDNASVDEFPLPSADEFAEADRSEAGICMLPDQGSVFRAMVRVSGFDQGFLLVARAVDPKALIFHKQAEQAVKYYDALSEGKLGVQIAFASMYALISLILLLSSVWIGLSFANWLVTPIRRMIFATDQVATGNYDVQVPVFEREGDIGHLGDTFNKMTGELRRQTDRLHAANQLMDRRRRFTEAVLSGVSAGVIGLDGHGRMTVINPSAERLLGADTNRLQGEQLTAIMPQLAPFIAEAANDRQRATQGQVNVKIDSHERTLTVRVASDQSGDAERSVIVTLDDVTDLVTAQRSAAWADIARRIAHEIKNPLTPIQLSAERIRRKYGKAIVEDRAVFDQCTDTIIRQVDDIKRMVDEFSSFARMPKPLPELDDVGSVIRQVLFLMRVANPDIAFSESLPEDLPKMSFDRRLISQALTNIVKNATEAIQAVPLTERGDGRVDVNVLLDDRIVSIDVSDNGKGFPIESRQRLLEPYMTTREGGTGLGLAIVGKILEEHGGGIALLDRVDGARGARVRLWFPAAGALSANQPETMPMRRVPE